MRTSANHCILWALLSLGATRGALAQTPAQTNDIEPQLAPRSGEPTPKVVQVASESSFPRTIQTGDTAYLARDFDQALARYREALQLSPESALAHYRLGETQRSQSQLSEAAASFEAALRFVGSDTALKTKLLFVLADLAERTHSLEVARTRWNAYAEYVAANQQVKAFAGTAMERSHRIETRRALEADYGAVKERIKKREAETPPPSK